MVFYHLVPAYCIGLSDDLTSLERRVKRQLSSIKYKCVLILIAHYNSYSKAVNYIIDNFTTLDLLSDDIDFQIVGYSNENNKPLESNQIAKDEILNKALDDLDSISPNERISQAEI